MRDAINNNPMVQLAVVAVLVLVAGVMLAPQLLGHKKSDSNTSTSSAQLTTPSGSVDLTVKRRPPRPRRALRQGPLLRRLPRRCHRRRWYLAGVCRAR